MTHQREQAGRGSLVLLLAIAGLPFLCKGAALAWFASHYLPQSLYKIFQAAGPIGWRRTFDGKTGWAAVWPFDEPLPSKATWLLAVGFAAAAVLATMTIVPPLADSLGIRPTEIRAHLDRSFAMTPWIAVVIVGFLSTINAALEELHFRAWLDCELRRRLGTLLGTLASSGAFAGMHLFIFAKMPGATALALGLLFVALFGAGVAWSGITRRPGGIHAAWLSHALTDAGLMTWGLWWLGYFAAPSAASG